MKLKIEKYADQLKRWPIQGQHVLGHEQQELVVVYQAYNHQIADYAVKNQILGGPHYSYNRMSWIKPNFLWMMYRCGWASKENQERVLAIWISKKDFEAILSQAVFSTFNTSIYEDQEAWKKDLNQKEVRLQWDPDHDPYGNKQSRRAIQIGMKGKILESFGKLFIESIEDITSFVKEQKLYLDKGSLDELLIPAEELIQFPGELKKKVGID